MSSEGVDAMPVSQLKDLINLIIDYRGKTPKKLGGDFTDSGIPVISAIHIKHGKIIWEERERFVSEDMYKKWMKEPLKKGDVLLTSEAPLGEVALVLNDDPLVLSQRLFALRTNPKLLDSNYLMYFLQSQIGQDALKGRSSGSTVVGIRQAELINIAVPCPPIEKQIIIGEVLATLDAKISVNELLSKKLEELAQTIFKSWFVNFDPVKLKMAGMKPSGMSTALAALFPDSMVDSEIGLIPKGWKLHSVGDLITPKKGKTITRATCTHGIVPVVAGGLQPAYFHNQSNVSQPAVTISASGANAGFVRLYLEDIWASDCSYINSEVSEYVFFWYLFLSNNQEKIYSMQQGAAQPHIYPSDLMRLKLCAPQKSELFKIFEVTASPLFSQILCLERQNKLLTEIRDSLLPRLISGELDIPIEIIAS